MAVQKHLRLPDEIAEQMEHRDKEKYPTENAFVAAAIQKFSVQLEQERVEKKLERIQQELTELHALCKKEFAVDDSYGKNFSY